MPNISCGTLFCVAMPIGNPKDITLRAMEVLGEVQLIACEDTRTAREALGIIGIRETRLLSYFEHNELQRTQQILQQLRLGVNVALISEAGTPTISDPGYRLVNACVEAGITVVPIPGACAAISALSASGLPTDRFVFVGFPPKKGARFQRFLAQWLMKGATTVFYIPARRLIELLDGITLIDPEAQIVVARELTKTYEEFVRGNPETLRAIFHSTPPRGECTVLVRPVCDNVGESE